MEWMEFLWHINVSEARPPRSLETKLPLPFGVTLMSSFIKVLWCLYSLRVCHCTRWKDGVSIQISVQSRISPIKFVYLQNQLMLLADCTIPAVKLARVHVPWKHQRQNVYMCSVCVTQLTRTLWKYLINVVALNLSVASCRSTGTHPAYVLVLVSVPCDGHIFRWIAHLAIHSVGLHHDSQECAT